MRYDGNGAGFTLIEIIIALAILTLLLGITLPLGWDFYTTTTLQSERDTLVSLVTRARAYTLTNRNSAPHGLALSGQTFTLFQGASYAAHTPQYDEPFPRTSSVVITGPSEIVFTPLSGDAPQATFTLTLGNKSRSITVNQEGMIDY